MFNPFLHNIRPYPLKLTVDIHSYCNAKCAMCPYPKYKQEQSQGYMDWGLYCKIVDEFGWLGKEHGFRPTMTYCYMADPFVADDVAKYTKYAQEQGVNVYLNTNGAGMTPAKLDALLESGFAGKIHVSFHGATKETYERIMGLSYDRSLKHLRYLLEHYDSKKICIRGVDDGWAEGEREAWKAMWSDSGAELEYVEPISRCGSVGRLLPGRLKDKDTVKLYGCVEHHPLVEMVILFDGRAVMCCQDMGREVIWGDVGQDGIVGVWNGQKRINLVKRLYSGKAHAKGFLCARCEQALASRGALASSIWAVGVGKLKKLFGGR